MPGQREIIGHFPASSVPSQGGSRQRNAGDDAERLGQIKPMLLKPRENYRHPCHITRAAAHGNASQARRNVSARQHKRFAGHAHDAFGRAATRAGRKPAQGDRRDVGANDGEVARFEFKEVRAAATAGTHVDVGLRTEFSEDHGFD